MTVILAVDDNASILDFYQELFNNQGFTILTANSAEDGLSQLENTETNIDVILSDIKMPNIDGYEFCEKVKAVQKYSEIPLIFVSGLVDLEEEIKGYNVGADDYVKKPIQTDEILAKINRVIAVRNTNRALSKQLDESNNVAKNALSYASHLGLIIEFVKDSLKVVSNHDISLNIFKFMQQFDLNVVFQVHTSIGIETYSHKGMPAPIEENILELSRDKGRVIDFGPRTLINYKTFSLLIKNMPLEDEEKYGMYKDILTNLCDIIEEKIETLTLRSIQSQKESGINRISDTLNTVVNDYETTQKETLESLNTMVSELENSFGTFDLMDYQEDAIKEIMDDCIAKTNASFERGAGVSLKFNEIKTAIVNMFNSQH